MTLEIQLVRRWFTERSTIGELSLPGFSCFVLEDRVRAPGVKVFGETAIPPGRYRVVLTYSPKFSPMLKRKRIPEILDVPNFADIRAHAGNRPPDTKGCLLTGTERGEDVVLNSRVAFYELLDRLEAADAAGAEMWLSVTEEPDTAFEAARAAADPPLPTYQRLIAA